MHKILTHNDLSKTVWDKVWKTIADAQGDIDSSAVAPRLDVEKMMADIKSFDLESGNSIDSILGFAIKYLKRGGIISHNASNFGSNGAGLTPLGISVEALVATFNPQLSTWIQNPFGVELEDHLIHKFSNKLKYANKVDGCFLNSEIESHQTAIVTALNLKFPEIRNGGLFKLNGAPVLYLSNQCHPSVFKAARICGLGTFQIRLVPNSEEPIMDTVALDSMIRQDIARGDKPFMIVGTAGSLKAGFVDPLLELTTIARHFQLWSHVDLGYGGLAIFQNSLDVLLEGLEFADSVSLDVNKLLHLPSDSFMFITREIRALENTFDSSDGYLPLEAFCNRRNDGLSRTIQWSKRFSGLKVFTALAVEGWKAYEEIHSFQSRMARYLRAKLEENGWSVLNKSHLPVVCFTKPELTVSDLHWITEQLVVSGRSGISVVSIDEAYCLRASITNFRTTELEVISLVDGLHEVLDKIWLRQNRTPEL